MSRMQLVAYLRVSSTNPNDHEDSAEEQLRKIHAWAAEHGYTIVASFTDAGVEGGADLSERPGLTKAVVMLRDGTAEGLAVSAMDRLARELYIQEAILAQVWKLDGTLFAADFGEIPKNDPDDPMRTAMRQMMGVFAQLDRAMRVKAMRVGKEKKRARGGYTGGPVPLGKRVVDKQFKPDDKELATIARIREMRGQGLSWRTIADTLNAEGVPAKNGGKWFASTISRAHGPERDR